MKFFVPAVQDPAVADYLYRTWAQGCRALPSPSRIYRIESTWLGKEYTYEVGQDLPEYPGIPIMAIFELEGSNFVAVGPGHGANMRENAGPVFILGIITAIEDFEVSE